MDYSRQALQAHNTRLPTPHLEEVTKDAEDLEVEDEEDLEIYPKLSVTTVTTWDTIAAHVENHHNKGSIALVKDDNSKPKGMGIKRK